MNGQSPDGPEPRDTPAPSVFTTPAGRLIRDGIAAAPSCPGALARLGRYDLLRSIGEGGMGMVWLARDTESGAKVAIKLLKPELAAMEKAAQRFLGEVRRMRELPHANIMPVLDVGSDCPVPYFVMPYFDRGSVATLIAQRGPLDESSARTIAAGVAAALQHAHANGLLHCDLKPANVLVDADGHPRLTDFGLSRVFSTDAFHQGTGEHCEGTAPYMSPAVAAGKVEDTRCDIYALGAMLYEMLTGCPPYRGATTQEEVRRQVIEGPPKPILALQPHASKRLAAVAETAMARDLKNRYAQMSDVLADLQRVQQGKEPLGTRKPMGLRPRTVGLGLGAAGLVALALWALLRPNPVVFDDTFVGSRIQARSWDSGTPPPYPPGTNFGHANARVYQETGGLVLQATIAHSNGWYVRQDAWVAPRINLRRVGNASVEIEYLITSTNAVVEVRAMPELLASDTYKTGGVTLASWDAPRSRPFGEGPARLLMDLPSAGGPVVVRRESGAGEARFVDVPGGDALHLLLAARASSSAGADVGAATLRLHRVRIVKWATPRVAAGKVADKEFGLPVPSAEVGVRGWTHRARCGGDGSYVLPLPPGTLALECRAPHHSTSQFAVHAETTGLTRADFALTRREAYYGGVVEARMFPALHGVAALTVTTNCFFFSRLGQSNDWQVLRQNADGQELVINAHARAGSGLAVVSNVLYGLGTWKQRGLYRFDASGEAHFLFDVPTPWPASLAFDGTNFWFVECDSFKPRWGLFSLNRRTGQVVAQVSSTNRELQSVAWGRGRLWVSDGLGWVYEVDPGAAMRSGSLEQAVTNRFRGMYVALCHDGRTLWAVTDDRRHLVKVDLESPP